MSIASHIEREWKIPTTCLGDLLLNCGYKIVELEQKIALMAKIDEKRLEQLREAWIRNVMKIHKLSYVEAGLLYNKIQPYKNI